MILLPLITSDIMGERYSKIYYKISEVADILGIQPSTLRFWEKEFPGLNPKRSKHNQRFYTPADIELLEIIKYLLYNKGLKIESAKEYLAHNKTNISNRYNVLKKLEGVRDDLQLMLKSLNLRIQRSQADL